MTPRRDGAPRPLFARTARTSPSRVLRLLAALVATWSLLAACAPGAAGIGGGGPRVDYQEGATYVAPAGGALHVTIDLPLEETGLTVAALDQGRLSWVPLGLRGESASLAAMADLPTAEVPEGWEVRLWQVRALRERPLGRPDAPLEYRVEAELRVDVPEDAEGLLRRVRAQIRFAGSETVPLDFLVRVE